MFVCVVRETDFKRREFTARSHPSLVDVTVLSHYVNLVVRTDERGMNIDVTLYIAMHKNN